MPRTKRRNLTAAVPLDSLRAIPGFPGYFVTDDGQVFSIGRLAVHRHQDGYLRVHILKDEGWRVHRKRLGVHQAVALAFIGPQPSAGMEVCHKDGDNSNNHPDNLYWGTRKKNAEDMVKHGRSLRGEKNHQAKLNAEQVRDIKARLADGLPISDIRRVYPFVSEAAIWLINSGKNWKHVC